MKDKSMFKEEYLRKAHGHSIYNYKEIKASKTCGCFYCKSTFSPNKIEDWIDEDNPRGKTALCPKCGIDSVIGSSSGYPIYDKKFLEEMNKIWFEAK